MKTAPANEPTPKLVNTKPRLIGSRWGLFRPMTGSNAGVARIGIALGSASQIALFVCAGARARELLDRAIADGPAVLARRCGHDTHRHHDRLAGHQ